jgi:serine/threonine protein kinase
MNTQSNNNAQNTNNNNTETETTQYYVFTNTHIEFGESRRQFRVLGQIASGSQGIVYQVQDENKNLFALKVAPGGNTNPRMRNTILRGVDREVQILKKIKHLRGVSKIHDCFYVLPNLLSKRNTNINAFAETNDDQPYDPTNFGQIFILMDYIEEKEITDHSYENYSFIYSQAWTTLQQLHQNGIVHLDIKDDNLIYDGSILNFIDFGVSCQKNLNCENANANTNTNNVDNSSIRKNNTNGDYPNIGQNDTSGDANFDRGKKNDWRKLKSFLDRFQSNFYTRL